LVDLVRLIYLRQKETYWNLSNPSTRRKIMIWARNRSPVRFVRCEFRQVVESDEFVPAPFHFCLEKILEAKFKNVPKTIDELDDPTEAMGGMTLCRIRG
jgi:hypothetical protein